MTSLYFDGACTPVNPGGVGTWGFVATLPNGMTLRMLGVCEDGKPSTNNIAEYYGLIHGLKLFLSNDIRNETINVFGDSLLVVNMSSGVWGRKKPHKKARHLLPLLEQVHALIMQLTCRGNKIAIQWIPREQNADADLQTKTAYKQYANGLNQKKQ